jgi:hypothetical protein
MKLQLRILPNFTAEPETCFHVQSLFGGQRTRIMNKTLALFMRVIVVAIVLVMATAVSKHVAAGMAKHMGMGLQVEVGTGGHASRSGL